MRWRNRLGAQLGRQCGGGYDRIAGEGTAGRAGEGCQVVKFQISKTNAVGGLLLAVTAVVTAEPLQRGHVVNDPVWVVHLDCDALRQTTIGHQLLVELDRSVVQKRFEAIQATLSLDPRKDLRGVTVYSATKGESDAVVLAYADFDVERLVSVVQTNKGYEVSTHSGHQIHSWIDERKRTQDGEPARIFSAVHTNKILILGQQAIRVGEALDVVDATQPSLATGKKLPQLSGGNGTFLSGAAHAVELPGENLGTAVLKQVKLVWLNAREAEGRFELKLALELSSAETAKHLCDVGRGLVAVLALQTDKPDAVKLSQAITIEQVDTGVAVKMSLPAADLVQMIKDQSGK